MRAVAHSAAFSSKVGVPQSVGREFASADARKLHVKKIAAALKGRR
ncbi:MAG: hypothetical protein NUV51_03805 [Sulfuricaulis sp.]|nr:hypothetical protein [Sulfuricaulis sp.]